MSALPICLPAALATATLGTDIAADRSLAGGSHPARTAHPDALRERAVALYCEGLRSPAIAAQLGISIGIAAAWHAGLHRSRSQQYRGWEARIRTWINGFKVRCNPQMRLRSGSAAECNGVQQWATGYCSQGLSRLWL